MFMPYNARWTSNQKGSRLIAEDWNTGESHDLMGTWRQTGYFKAGLQSHFGQNK